MALNGKPANSNTSAGFCDWTMSFEQLVRTYLELKELDITPVEEGYRISVEIPKGIYISSFYKSDDPKDWEERNAKKVATKAKLEATKDERYLKMQLQREVRTALDGFCSLHRKFQKIVENKCVYCEENKMKRGLPNEYSRLDNLYYRMRYPTTYATPAAQTKALLAGAISKLITVFNPARLPK